MSESVGKKPPTAVISARMSAELVDRIYQTARSQKKSASSLVEEAVIRAMSSKDVKPASGGEL